MNRRALEGREKVLGKEHPDTLTSVSNLAVTWRDRASMKEAEAMNRRALEGSEKVLGKGASRHAGERPTTWSGYTGKRRA